MYSPTMGQWLSEDPIEFEGLDENLKRYVRNSPTMLIDPDGLSPTNGAGGILVPIIGPIYTWQQPGPGLGPTPRSDVTFTFISYPNYPANLYYFGPPPVYRPAVPPLRPGGVPRLPPRRLRGTRNMPPPSVEGLENYFPKAPPIFGD